MRTVLSSVLLDVPRAAVIWLSLLGVVAAALVVLLLRPGRFRFEVGARIRDAAMPSRLEFAEEDEDRERYAREVGVAADRAAETARRRRAEWLAAQEEAEESWRAYEAAEAEVDRLSGAAGMPLPRTGRTPAEYADRERWLHQAALAAYWRRELSEEQLSDVFAHRAGWDPRLHPVEQELVLRRAVRDHLSARQRAARQREQDAWRTAELAAAAARSLREEARAAAGALVEEVDSVLPLAAPAILEPTREVPVVTREVPVVTREVPVVTREVPAGARGRAAVPAF
ncbi:hypothetical protein GA0070616_3056 [Micromonospora nigra]|uniref:AP2/ERF domain-containing protein n=1 Tax=Micromonospora nigra TaxID=145857 RepID=A0A1C6S713_9ACTN|nr:hypothetical protein [Micromonospora nigra]SCL25170.1 hypothetical protein GA0070616_3056 [Micromonospora nigra]